MSRACDIWADACVDAAEGEPTPEFALHLERCAPCRDAVEELRVGLEILRPDPAPVPGPWLAASIRRATESAKRKRPRSLWTLAPVAAALLLLIGLGTYTLFSPGPPSVGVFDQAALAVHGSAAAPPEYSESWLVDDPWYDDWGAGVDMLLSEARDEELRRLVDNLSRWSER